MVKKIRDVSFYLFERLVLKEKLKFLKGGLQIWGSEIFSEFELEIENLTRMIRVLSLNAEE